MPEQGSGVGSRAAAEAWLRERVIAADYAGGPERRHDTLMERADEWGVARVEAEAVFALAEEEGLDPELGLLLRVSGLGVTELEPITADRVEPGQQQSPPGWVAGADLVPEEAQRERRLRLSFRRLRGLLYPSRSAAEALDRFLSEPDVVEGAYRIGGGPGAPAS
jgi:hypothetical protein